jgi:hypothetical protein
MKICPRCGLTTTDDAQAFCLMDGTPLVDQLASEPTVVMSRTDPTVTTQQPGKKKTGMWITLAILGILVIGGLIGILMYAAYRMGSETASIKVNTNSNTLPTPKPSGTPKAPPQTTPSTAPAQQATPESTPGEVPNSDEPTPISWTGNAAFVKTDVGLRYTFECPPDGTPGTVWGSDVYTADSSVCTAAVHAGKITLEKGGIVTIEFTAGRQMYGATTRNGITTYNYGQYPHSFVFR